MKKIISALIILAMLCSVLLAAIPAFADVDEAKAALQNLYDEVEDLKEKDYTQETWDPFAEALATAQSLLGEQYPDEDKLGEAKDALDAAAAALKEITMDDLKAKIDAGKVFENVGYSTGTWNALQEALTEAEEFYDDNVDEDFVDEDELKGCYATIKKALANMKYDTSKLNPLLDKSKPLYNNHNYAKGNGYLGDYTEESFAVFSEAYLRARTDANSNNLEKITKATEDLEAALAGLEMLPVPEELKTKLADLMDLADVLIPEEWSESAWKMVEMKVEQANNAKNNIMVSTYVKAVLELEQALKNLTNEDKEDKEVLPSRPVVDTGYLDDLIKWCDDNLVESGYDADSWRKLSEALTTARAVSENPRKADNVKAAYDRLLKAKNELVAVEGAAGGEGDVAGEGGCKGFIATTFVVMSATLALGATVVLRKKED